MEKLRPRKWEGVAQSHIPKSGLTWVFQFLAPLLLLIIITIIAVVIIIVITLACTPQRSPGTCIWTRVFHSHPSHLQPPPILTNLFAIPGTNVEVIVSEARILLAAESPALCLLCTQRQPKLAHVFQRLPPPSPPRGPTGNSAKIIISNWGFVQSSGKTSSPFRIISLCY